MVWDSLSVTTLDWNIIPVWTLMKKSNVGVVWYGMVWHDLYVASVVGNIIPVRTLGRKYNMVWYGLVFLLPLWTGKKIPFGL